MGRKKLNVANVMEAIRALPGRRNNPYIYDNGYAWCVYTDERDASRHCIAGQVLVDLGYRRVLPAVGSLDNYQKDARQILSEAGVDFDAEAANILNEAQYAADLQTRTEPRSVNAWAKGKEAAEQWLPEIECA